MFGEVSVNTGYGHQWIAHPLRDFAYDGRIWNVNDYDGIPNRDHAIWEESSHFYEAILKPESKPPSTTISLSLKPAAMPPRKPRLPGYWRKLSRL